jgi:chromosome partitioning protein
MATPIIALASTKGGVGKTTLAFCLATTLARRLSNASDDRNAGISADRGTDMPVFCLDADPNQTLFQTIRRGKPQGVGADVATSDTLLEAVTETSRRSRLVLIDLEGSSNQAMLYACGKANLVLIPAQPSMFDVVEAMKTAAVVARAADLTGRPLDCRVVLTRTPVLRQRVTEHSRRQFEQRGLAMLSAELVERAAFRMMTYTGKSPLEDDPEGGAAGNVEALAAEVAALVGLKL